MNSWYVYIILCKNDKLYTGIAKNVKERFELHKSGKGAKYTRSNKPIKIVYTKKFKTRSEASKREAEIKKLSRPQKENMIKN